MLERFATILSILFATIWAVVVFVQYWQYNPNYGQSFQYFQYPDLLLLFLGLGIAANLTLNWARKAQKQLRFINGLSIFAILLLLDAFALGLFYHKVSSIDLNSVGLFTHLGHFTGVALSIYFIYLTCRILGAAFTTVFPIQIARADLSIIQTALGLIGITFSLFLLGAFHLLHWFIIWPLLLLIVLIRWRTTLDLIKTTLFQTIEIPKRFNALGLFSFLFLAIFMVFDFAQLLRPFPLGTDSINLYVNLPRLIADYGSLVAGHQPYNWSLFMSLGLLAFGRIDVVLALSFLGGVLSLMALFRLSRKWLDVNYAALCLLLFFSVPMINFLSYMDMKIDLGLLYMTLCILLLFVNWISPTNEKIPAKKIVQAVSTKGKKGTKPNPKKTKKPVPPDFLLRAKAYFAGRIPSLLVHNRLIVLMGLLAGFSFGIKLTTLFVFFALMTAIWYIKGGKWAFLSAVMLTLGTTFLLRLDDNALLRQYHENVNLLQWGLLAAGLGLSGYLLLQQRESMQKLIKLSLVLSAFFLLPITPWFGKNWMETKSLTVDAILNGKKATPQIDIKTIEEKWKATYQ